MVAYFYIRNEESEEALECGLKLSVYGKPIPESGDIPIKAIRALLSPRDDIEKFNDDRLLCLKLDLPGNKLLVAEDLFAIVEKHEWFNESIIHASNYLLGKYKKPCYLIPFTVLGEYVSVLDKKRDVPVLYDNSARLYIETMKSRLEETDPAFHEKALYGYLRILVRHEKASIEWSNEETVIFSMDGERYILNNPINEK